MKYNPDVHHRRSIRLQGYDYSRSGGYFVTICTENRECLFGDVIDGEMALNDAGRIAADEWTKTALIRDEIQLDEWVVMPNHFHGIVWITHGTVRHCRGDRPVAPTTIRPVAPTAGPQPRSLGAMIAGFKSAVTKRINELRQTAGAKLWQRNYYEHIVRNENELNRIRQYIIDNPKNWKSDRNYPTDNAHAVRAPIPKHGDESWMI